MKPNPNDGASGPGTIVGVNVALSGTLKDQNDIAVYGMVDGQVESERSVTVGQSAQVKGPVKGQLITVAGTVHGEITAHEKLEVLETGKIYGSIETKDLIVRSGALLSGKVTMGTDEPAAETPEPEFKEEKIAEAAEPADEPASETKAETTPELTPDEE
ncbi:MAG TPA: polymer-forming cytoskeletal protein [Candidatus Saccharimonadales bacterium]|nr:polymer-forming cytoskeletal protein [Candidatus Saccharimonadales bacterium]